MTQLPEVEVLRKELEKEVVGKRFKEITVSAARLVAEHGKVAAFKKALDGRKIESLERRGVHLLFELDEDMVLIVDPGSRARVTRETATEDPGENTIMVATFTTGGSIHLRDIGGDAQAYVLSAAELEDLPGFAGTGFDPLADTVTWPAFAQQLTARNHKLKTLLMDQSFIVGLGDLYSDEILYTAGLSGARVSTSLSTQEIRRLHRAVQEVLYEAVKQGGTDDPGDEEEGFADLDEVSFVHVFEREGEPCDRCRQQIVRRKITKQYYAYFCPHCQT